MRPEAADSPAFRKASGLALLFVALAFLLKVPTLWFDHDEPDEQVYLAVADNLLHGAGYTLRGAEILSRLSPRIYDHPLFHHPPLLPVLLLPFVAAGAVQAAVVISWLGHGLCILSLALIGRAVVRGPPGAAAPGWLWIPLFGVATDPLLVNVSRKLWIDGLLVGLVSLAVALVYVARASRHERTLTILAGVVLGLAGLAKAPALLAGAVIAVLILADEGSLRERLARLARVAVPSALIVLPWFVVFWATYGALTPTWLEPDAFNMRAYPFVAAAVARPWYYYAAKLCLVQPVVVLALAAHAGGARAGVAGGRRWAPLVWFLLFLVVATIQGASGYGFQMRYVAPVVPAVYAMLCCHPAMTNGGRRAAAWRVLLVAAMLWAALSGLLYLLTPRYDEVTSLPELLGRIRW